MLNKKLWDKYKVILINVYITSIIGFVFNVTDSYLVSTISQDAVAAIGLMIPLILITTILFFGVNGSFARFTGQSFGGSRKNRLKKEIYVGTVVIFTLSLIMFLIMYFSQSLIPYLYNTTQNIEQLMLDYYSIWVFDIILVGLASYYGTIASSIDMVKIITRVGILGMIINFIISLVLINGYLGLPKMEIQGAALGTVITTILMVILRFYYMNKKNYIDFKVKKVYLITIFKRVRKYILPNIIQGLAMPLGITFLTVVASTYSADQLAAFTLAHRFDLLWFVVVSGLGTAYNILLSHNFGSKNEHNINELFKLTVIIGLVLSMILLFISVYFSTQIGSIFFESKQTINIYSQILPYIVVIYPFWHIIGMVNQFLVNASLPNEGLKLGLFRQITMYVIFPFIGSYYYGFEGFLMGYALGAVPGFIYAIYLMKTKQNIIKYRFL